MYLLDYQVKLGESTKIYWPLVSIFNFQFPKPCEKNTGIFRYHTRFKNEKQKKFILNPFHFHEINTSSLPVYRGWHLFIKIQSHTYTHTYDQAFFPELGRDNWSALTTGPTLLFGCIYILQSNHAWRTDFKTFNLLYKSLNK